jgi:thymidylate synthase (FAD)
MIAECKVLDHGYLRVVESWGSDQAIIESARMSTDKGFLGWGDADNPGDERLLGYLYRNQHSTPFEFAGCVVEVQAPIFVFREWHRHRTQSFSELSARHSPMPDLNYVPSLERVMARASASKQAQGTGVEVTEEQARIFRCQLQGGYDDAQSRYELALNNGVPKELARLGLPVARYSRMRASANLRNWLGFLQLRMATNAQWEMVQYANALHAVLVDLFPRTLQLFNNQRSK